MKAWREAFSTNANAARWNSILRSGCEELGKAVREKGPKGKKNSPDLSIGAGDQNRSIRQRMPVWTGEYSESVQVGLSGNPEQANNSHSESMWLNLNTRIA
jgi:hypothetical protein